MENLKHIPQEVLPPELSRSGEVNVMKSVNLSSSQTRSEKIHSMLLLENLMGQESTAILYFLPLLVEIVIQQIPR